MSRLTARELLDVEPDTEMDVESILAARVEKVLALHRPVRTGTKVDGTARMQCDHCGGLPPCPTVRLLNGEEQ